MGNAVGHAEPKGFSVLKKPFRNSIVRIPRNCASALLHRDDFNQLVTLLLLKSLYRSNNIQNIRARYQSLANQFGISESKLRKDVNYLVKSGFATLRTTKKGRKDLHLCAYSDLDYTIGREGYLKETLFYKTHKQLQTEIKSRAISANLRQQQFAINKDITKAVGFRRTPKNYIQWIATYNRIFNCRKAMTSAAEQVGAPYVFNMTITVSRRKVSSLINRKSHTTASRQVKKMKALGLVEKDIVRETILSTKDIPSYCLLNNTFGVVIKKKSSIVLRMCNELRVIHREKKADVGCIS